MATANHVRPPNEDLAGLILAGGEGRRMGGVDKGLIDWQGRPLVAWVAERLLPQVGTLLISANRHPERYAAWSTQVLADDPALGLEAFPGPLGGIASGLAASPSPLLLCVPCDSPCLPLDLGARLRAQLGEAEAAVAVSDGRWQPTFCLLSTHLLPRLRAALAGGERRVAGWLQAIGAVPVPFPDPASFANANRPEELAALRPAPC